MIIHGCRFPDKEAGQIPMAYVVRKQGSTLSQGSVIDFVAKQVIFFRVVFFLHEFSLVVEIIGLPSSS